MKTVPLIAPEYGAAAIELDDSLGTVHIGLNAVPSVANEASSIAETVDNVLPFGWCRRLDSIIYFHHRRDSFKILS